MSEMCDVPREPNGRWNASCLDDLKLSVVSEEGPQRWVEAHCGERDDDWRLLGWLLAWLVAEKLDPEFSRIQDSSVVYQPVVPVECEPEMRLAFQLLGATLNRDPGLASDVMFTATRNDQVPEMVGALLTMLKAAESGNAALVHGGQIDV